MKRVLIIEDEGLTRWSLKNCLQEKFCVDAVSNWDEALNFIKKITYDIVITDFRLPGQNGFENIQQVKKIFPNIKSILITAYPSTIEEYLSHSGKIRPDLILDKMFYKDDLIQAVEDLASQDQYQTQKRKRG